MAKEMVFGVVTSLIGWVGLVVLWLNILFGTFDGGLLLEKTIFCTIAVVLYTLAQWLFYKIDRF